MAPSFLTGVQGSSGMKKPGVGPGSSGMKKIGVGPGSSGMTKPGGWGATKTKKNTAPGKRAGHTAPDGGTGAYPPTSSEKSPIATDIQVEPRFGKIYKSKKNKRRRKRKNTNKKNKNTNKKNKKMKN